MKEYRCAKCKKLLFYFNSEFSGFNNTEISAISENIKDSLIEIKCKCGYINKLRKEQLVCI